MGRNTSAPSTFDALCKAAFDTATTRTSGGSPSLSAVYQQYQPLIDKEANRWSASGLPRVVLVAEAKRIVARAMTTHDPVKGTLGTHLQNNLRRLDDFVNTYANDVRMPVDRAHLANRLLRQQASFRLENGRPPTVDESAVHLGIKPTTVGQLARTQTQLSSAVEGAGFQQPMNESLSHGTIMLDFLHQDLTAQQRQVFEHTFGYNGQPKLSTTDIASKLGLSASRVASVRNEVFAKAKQYNYAIGSLMN